MKMSRVPVTLLLVVLFVAGVVGVASAQVTREEFDALKSEVNTLKESLKAQNDLFRQLVERLGAGRGDAPFKETLVGLDGGAVYGRPDAKVTIVECSD